jgi:hypothetical protein
MKASAIIIGWEGSSAELSAILDRMRPAANGDFFLNDKSSESEKRVVRQPLGSFPWTPDIMRKFWEHLHRKDDRKYQVRVLEALVNGDGAISKEELVRKVKIENEALKGVLSSLTRNAKKITGYENVRVVEPGSDGRSYTLADPLLSFIRSEMDKNG